MLELDYYCWFCGCRHPRLALIVGADVREMVTSSHIIFQPDDEPAKRIGESREIGESMSCRMCRECLSSLHAKIRPIGEEQMESHVIRADSLMIERSNYETYLIEQNERTLWFGCWFGYYPWAPDVTRFHAMSIAQLYDCGLRFRGEYRLNDIDVAIFLEHFEDRSLRGQSSDECRAHLSGAFGITDKETRDRFATVRACIYDISVAEFASRDLKPT